MKLSIFINPNRKDDNLKQLFLDKLSSYSYEYDEINPDVVIYLGGDGTFLRAVNHYIDKINSIKFIGLNAGKLGFFYSYNIDTIDDLLDDLFNGNVCETDFRLLKGEVFSQDGNSSFYAVNEIRIENPYGRLLSPLEINGNTFETLTGNGVLVCSTLGSTAYNKSLGGSVICHDLKDLLEITEISPVTNAVYRSLASPMIMPGETIVSLKGHFKSLIVTYDYQGDILQDVYQVTMALSNKVVTILRPNHYSYLDSLKKAFVR